MRKQRLIAMATTGLVLSILLSVPAFAQTEPDKLSSTTPMEESDRHSENMPGAIPYPTDIQLLEQGERNYLYKTFTVDAEYDPDQLVEASFSQGGYRYRFNEIIQRDHIPGSTEKAASDSITLETDTDDPPQVLAMFEKRLPYVDDDGYQGELLLIPESLSVTEAGRSPYSYTISEVRNYADLSRNDPALIPKSIDKNGKSLTLMGIDWQVTGSTDMGYSDVPTKYTASATYTGLVNGTKVSGYIASVSYSGSVAKKLAGKSIYTIVYEGEQIIIPFNYVPLIIAGLIAMGCIVLCIVLWKNRSNAEIYTMQKGMPVFHSKTRVNPRNAMLKIPAGIGTEVKVVLDKRLQKALRDYGSTILVEGQNMNHTYSTDQSLAIMVPAPTPFNQEYEQRIHMPETITKDTGGIVR